MGEAKRRKKLDPTYGKTPSLKTQKDREKYIEQVLDDLYSQYGSELKTLTTATEIPQNYDEIKDKLTYWMKDKLSKYRDKDKQIIAHTLLQLVVEMKEKYDASSVVIICFIEIFKSYFSAKIGNELADILEDLIEEEGLKTNKQVGVWSWLNVINFLDCRNYDYILANPMDMLSALRLVRWPQLLG